MSSRTPAVLGALLVMLVAAPVVEARETAPRMPVSITNTKPCGNTTRFGFKIRVYITRNKSLSCRRAKQIMRRSPMKQYRRYDYFDFTKGGRDTFWTDVWTTKSRKTVIGGVLQA